MRKTRIRWARVEYQPNLQTPGPPIPIGVVVSASMDADWKWTEWVVVGREPVSKDDPPPELKEVGALGFVQLADWIDDFAGTIGKASRAGVDVFAALSDRWRWNLYIVEPEDSTVKVKDLVDDIGIPYYEEYVGETFPQPSKKPKSDAPLPFPPRVILYGESPRYHIQTAQTAHDLRMRA